MFSKWSRVAVPVLALALAACGGAAKDGDGSLNVTVSALGGVAGKVFIEVTPATGAPQVVEATGAGDKFTASIAALPPGTYTVYGWGYSPEQVAGNPAIAPPAAAKYESRGALLSFTVVAGQATSVRLVLTEADSATLSHAPYSDFITVTAPLVVYPGDAVVITANGFDPDSDLATWSFGATSGVFTPAASGVFSGTESSYSATWTPSTFGVFTISLSVTDSTGNSSVVSFTVTVSQRDFPTTFDIEIDAAPAVAQALFTSDGQIAVGDATAFESRFVSADPVTAVWSNDCGGVFANESLALVNGEYVATASFSVAVQPEFGTCYVKLVVTDGGASVTQELGIGVGDPFIQVLPPVVP